VGRLVLLGTAAAVPAPDHAHTSLAVEEVEGILLVDCGENVLPRLNQAGLDPSRLRGLLLTHFHPDHAAGVPLLIVHLWLLGRQTPLGVYGPQDALDRLRIVMEQFRWDCWEGLYPVEMVEIAPVDGEVVLENVGVRVRTAEVEHMIPALAYRFESLHTGGTAAYSGDTEPAQSLVELARGVDLLLHEATGEGPGHSSPAQAGDVARQAGVGRLVLVHYPPQPDLFDIWLEQAQSSFDGPVELGRDMQVLNL
jgi:ribonuclease Z